MTGYLMDFGFGGFIGYGKGMSVGLLMEELNRGMSRFWLLAAVVADDLIDLYDDVLGDAGFYGKPSVNPVFSD